MKKIISYILLAVFVLAVCVSNVSALEINNDEILMPSKIEDGVNIQYSYEGGSNNYYQIIDVSNNDELIDVYNNYVSASDEDTEAAYLTELESLLDGVAQDENWVAISGNEATFEYSPEPGHSYLLIIKVASSDNDEAVHGVRLYEVPVEESNDKITENEDTGINDTLLIVGVPMLLVAGVYFTTRKQYN